VDMHDEIGHFGKGRTLAEITKCYFLNNCIEEVKDVVQSYKQCQLVKRMGSIRSKIKELIIILIWDRFYIVVLDIARPLFETYNRNKYILVAIDHYFKWCEAKIVVDHDAETTTRFLEDEIIYKFSVPKYVLIDNGYEWVVKFNQLCKNYGIEHQHTTP